MGRPTPLTIPVVTLIPTFNGLPMAMTGSPTPTESESPSVSGSSASRGASTFMTATSVEGSCPTTSAALRVSSTNLTEMFSASSTTCWLVTMCPASSTTNPDPPAGPASVVAATSTLTTPRTSRAYTSGTEVPSSETVVLEDPCGGATSFMVTFSDFSSRPYTPTTRKSAVMRPPMNADTSAVRAVLKLPSLVLLSLSQGPAAQFHDVPAVYLPPVVLLHEVPGSLVVLDLFCQRGPGLAYNGRRVARDLGVRPLYEDHALHLIERALEGSPVRERAPPPLLAQEFGGSIVISIGGHRVKRPHRVFRGPRRELAPFRYFPRRSLRGSTLGRGRRARA